MKDEIEVSLDLNEIVYGTSGEPEKDLIGQIVKQTEYEEKYNNANDLTVGRLIYWMLMEGIEKGETMEMTKKTIKLIDDLEEGLENKGIWTVTEGTLSKLEEIIQKVKPAQMTAMKYMRPIITLIQTGKDEIGKIRLAEKEKPKDKTSK